MRTDNDLEYLNNKFIKFYKDNEIAQHNSLRLTSQYNGHAERMNKTSLENVKWMLSFIKLDNTFRWSS